MLRTLTVDDVSHLTALEVATQPSPWSAETFTKCLSAGSIGWVIEREQHVIGFVFILANLGEAHVLNLCVHPHFQHQGFGRQLLNHALSTLKEQGINIAYLEVRRSNHKAINLYKNLGFIQIGERKNYYVSPTTPEDALVFAKDLSRE